MGKVCKSWAVCKGAGFPQPFAQRDYRCPDKLSGRGQKVRPLFAGAYRKVRKYDESGPPRHPACTLDVDRFSVILSFWFGVGNQPNPSYDSTVGAAK